MTTIPVGYAEVSFQFVCAGLTDPIVTTIGILSSAGPLTAAAIATAARSSWTVSTGVGRPFTQANMSNLYTLVSVNATLMTVTGPQLGTDAIGLTGSSATSHEPPQVAALVRKGTARGGRAGRGRMFLPAALIGDADVNETGQLTSAFRTAQQPKLDAALADMNTATIPAYLLHTDPTMTPDAITALTLLTTVGTQRRRLR